MAPVLLSNVVRECAGKGAKVTHLGAGGGVGTRRSVSGIGSGAPGAGRMVGCNVSTLRDVSGGGAFGVLGTSEGVRCDQSLRWARDSCEDTSQLEQGFMETVGDERG